MRSNITGIEGFVLKMTNGNLIKWKTDWWRGQRIASRRGITPNTQAKDTVELDTT
jgi:hypothetical protein